MGLWVNPLNKNILLSSWQSKVSNAVPEMTPLSTVIYCILDIGS